MVYPIVTPPVRPSVFFNFEPQAPPKGDGPYGNTDPNLHPLYGIAVNQYTWPERTEYQSSYCLSRNWNQQEQKHYLCSMIKPLELKHDTSTDLGIKGQKRRTRREDLGKLYDPTPVPLLDKHFKGYYYRIDDPIGIVTNEEVTKCKDTVLGLTKIRTQDEMENTYLPNYRYKEWTTQPQLQLVQQLEYNYPLCRLPLPDTRQWDLYHRVRMGRPSPEIKGEKFGVCNVIPIPRKAAIL